MARTPIIAAVAACVSLGGLADTASAQIAQGRLVTSGLVRPIWMGFAPGDPSPRQFVIEKSGVIRIVLDGTVNPTPFLDVTAITTGGTTIANEQGLLGLAFHPNYQSNGLLYIYHVTGASPGATTLAEYRVLGDPATSNVVDTTTRRVVLSIPQPFTNHNGGWIAFGPDGFLYIASGDGGSGNDPQGNGQSLNTLLGKMLRIDVNGMDPGLQYAIPPSNPFVGVAGRDEIWAYGLRNPWRCSFDRATGDLYIGDVGQNAREEINWQPASSPGGENYGWRCMEGNISTGLSGCTPFSPLLTMPVHVYNTGSGGTCAVTGGYVYRGSLIPRLVGSYVFGDYCSGQIWAFDNDHGTISNFRLLFDMGSNLTSFGEDAMGELYYTAQSSSQLWRIVAVACSPADLTAGAVAGVPGYGEPNGVITNDDFFYYLTQFAAGNIAVADLTTTAIPGSPGYGVPNGIITNDDFFYYLTLFSAGCPS